MAWFDGTTDWSEEEIVKEYPIEITGDLRTNQERSKIALINQFQEESELYRLSDPHMEEGKDIVFYHIFQDEPEKVREVFADFLKSEHDPYCFLLFRREPDSLYEYSCGHICKSLIDQQEELQKQLEKSLSKEATGVRRFILPLKRFLFQCPVCGQHTLQERGFYDICRECGWEDEGIDNEDVQSGGANGEYTIREWREEYLKRKAEDPNYNWRNYEG